MNLKSELEKWSLSTFRSKLDKPEGYTTLRILWGRQDLPKHTVPLKCKVTFRARLLQGRSEIMAHVFTRKLYVVASFWQNGACLCYDHSHYVCLHMHFKTYWVLSGVLKCTLTYRWFNSDSCLLLFFVCDCETNIQTSVHYIKTFHSKNKFHSHCHKLGTATS